MSETELLFLTCNLKHIITSFAFMFSFYSINLWEKQKIIDNLFDLMNDIYIRFNVNDNEVLHEGTHDITVIC